MESYSFTDVRDYTLEDRGGEDFVVVDDAQGTELALIVPSGVQIRDVVGRIEREPAYRRELHNLVTEKRLGMAF